MINIPSLTNFKRPIYIELNKNPYLYLIKLGYIIENDDIYKPSPENLFILEGILYEIGLINKKGFVNSTNLFDEKEYSLLAKYALLLLKEDTSSKDLTINEKIELGKWSYNLIMLELLYILEIGLNKANHYLLDLTTEELKSDDDSADLLDLIENYKEFIRIIMTKIEPSIKHKIRKGGITIIHNTYTGYDTEYQNKDLKYNNLLTVQLAVTTRINLKIPLIKEYQFSQIDTLTGKMYCIKVDRESSLDYDLILKLINNNINGIRSTKYKGYDLSLNKIVGYLKNKNIPHIEIEEKSSILFSFERTPIETWFKIVDEEGFSFIELVRKSNEMALNKREADKIRILDILKNIHNDKDSLYSNNENETNLVIDLVNLANESKKYKESLKKDIYIENEEEEGESLETMTKTKRRKTLNKSKQYTRTNMQSFTNKMVSVTEVKNNYFIGHLTSADLSVLKDFDTIKDNLDIVNGCFVTIGKPMLIDNVNVIIRDTMLLAPGLKKSLGAIGSLYDTKLNKIDIGNNINNMKHFLKENPVLFEHYALQDAVITLIHASFMEDFNFSIGSIGIPLTLSTLSRNYILNKWRLEGYNGYQITPEFLLGDVLKGQTPKGLNYLKTTGQKMSLYISNYKGGRNESFMYGIDNQINWFDYDLISAYTTAMAMLGDPDYSKGKIISKIDLSRMSKEDILYSFIIIKCTFKFPSIIKYPSIPCFLDETTTIYPLEGSAVLTGSEYLLAISQGCELKIEEIYWIPFKQLIKNDETVVVKPFELCIKELQNKRVLYPKGSINNLIYKDIGNSIYGLTVKGMSNKMKFDIKTKQTIRMGSGVLSNPIIASWTTALIRSVIGELLHNIHKEGGLIVSVTTDGFITNIEDLESVMVKDISSFSLFKEYKKMRNSLSGNNLGLEIKKTTKGVVSWTTRGQFSKVGELKASTGFQTKSYNFDELDLIFKNTLNSPDKTISFIQTSLRSALDIYKKGGHVTPTYSDRVFRMWYDNRRCLIIPKELKSYFNDNEKINFTDILLDSNPVKSIDEGKLYRFYASLNKTSIYEKKASNNSLKTMYKSYLDLAVRNFLKGLMKDSYNLDSSSFANYKDIIDYIHSYDKTYKITPNNLAQLKRKGVIKRPVVKTTETLGFVEFVKNKFPKFDEGSFFK